MYSKLDSLDNSRTYMQTRLKREYGCRGISSCYSLRMLINALSGIETNRLKMVGKSKNRAPSKLGLYMIRNVSDTVTILTKIVCFSHIQDLYLWPNSFITRYTRDVMLLTSGYAVSILRVKKRNFSRV